ncbi:hypothetical protein [Dapis sp. BLCC M229]|uniref:hypothetical protein n=1 Tax=Dapis sp. BLCC M229 TaxID=3400188 RepID=UPI003CE930D1
MNALENLEISPYYQHTAKLQQNRDYAKIFAHDSITSKLSSDKEPLLYMLLFHQNKYHGIFYNPNTNKLTEPEIVKVLNKIACEESTLTANRHLRKLKIKSILIQKLSILSSCSLFPVPCCLFSGDV